MFSVVTPSEISTLINFAAKSGPGKFRPAGGKRKNKMKFFHRHAAKTKIHIGFNGVGHTTFCGFESRFAEDFPTDFRRAKDGREDFGELVE